MFRIRIFILAFVVTLLPFRTVLADEVLREAEREKYDDRGLREYQKASKSSRKSHFGFENKIKIDKEALRKQEKKREEEIRKARKDLELGNAGRGVDVEAGYDAASD